MTRRVEKAEVKRERRRAQKEEEERRERKMKTLKETGPAKETAVGQRPNPL